MDTCTCYKVFSDAIGFVSQVIRLKNVVLGIRWTTYKRDEWNNGEYKKKHTDEMFDMLTKAGVDKIEGQTINFFIRAHYANRSREHLMDLYEKLNKTNTVTFTLYSDEQYWFKGGLTPLDKDAFSDVIKFLGPENVYLQVSDDVRANLSLHSLSNPRAMINSVPSFVQLNFIWLFSFISMKFAEILVFHQY